MCSDMNHFILVCDVFHDFLAEHKVLMMSYCEWSIFHPPLLYEQNIYNFKAVVIKIAQLQDLGQV